MELVHLGREFVCPKFIYDAYLDGNIDWVYEMADFYDKDFMYREIDIEFYRMDNIKVMYTFKPIEYLLMLNGNDIDNLITEKIIDVNRIDGIEKWILYVNRTNIYGLKELINNLMKLNVQKLSEWRNKRGQSIINLVVEFMLSEKYYDSLCYDFIEMFIDSKCNLSNEKSIMTLAILGMDNSLIKTIIKHCFTIGEYMSSSEMNRLPLVVDYLSSSIKYMDDHSKKKFRKVFETLIINGFPIDYKEIRWEKSIIDIIWEKIGSKSLVFHLTGKCDFP